MQILLNRGLGSKRRIIHIWRLLAVLLVLINIIVIIAWSLSAHALKTTRNQQREAFGLHYSYIVEELKDLIEQNIAGENIPEENRAYLIKNIAIVQYAGEQLDQHLNKHDLTRLNMIVAVINALHHSIESKQFQNYCHVSDQATVTNLEGYIYLLDQLPSHYDSDNGLIIYQEVINNWPYRTINELYSSCSLKS